MGVTGQPRIRVRDYRPYELERVAGEALRGAERCLRGPRVDVERLVLEKFRISIVTFADLKSRWDTYAFIDTTAAVIFIDAALMNEARFERKYRFTLAEELAHFLIHRELFANCRTVEDRLRLEDLLDEQTRALMESNAKALASAILMPKSAVEALVEGLAGKLADEHGHILVDQVVSALAREHDVSFQAARRRMINLGYRQRLNLDLL